MKKRSGPDFTMRLAEEKDSWTEAAKQDGFRSLTTWIKWVIRNYLSKRN